MGLRRIAQVKPWHDLAVVSTWPRPRGKVKSARQAAWVRRFSEWACATKAPDAQTYDQAKEWAKGTGWFWRDVLTSAMAGKLVMIEGETKITTPTARLHRNATEGLVANVPEVINLDAMIWDNNGFWAASPTPSRLLFKSPGLYLVGGELNFDNSATDGSRSYQLRLNGTTVIATVRGQDIANADIILPCSTIYYMHANDYLEVVATSTVTSQVNWTILWTVAITPEAILPD